MSCLKNLGLGAFAVLLMLQTPPLAAAAPAIQSGQALDRGFHDAVHPFLETYCFKCHSGDEPEADLDLSAYSSVDAVVTGFPNWELVLEKLSAAEMPPKKAKRHPEPQLRQSVVTWIQSLRRSEAQRMAGDPGPVLARRLSNSEYDYTIHDLTGADIRPAREFPIDPANQAGFDNSGESLMMSPGLLKKYLEAARTVADHLLLTTDGFEFASHPVVTDTDRDKYYVLRIVDFYRRQPTDLAGYFTAAWSYQHRAALGEPTATLARIAAENKVSARYLATLWTTLTDGKDDVGPLAKLRAMWRELPTPGQESARTELRQRTARMREYVTGLRAEIVPEVPNLAAPMIKDGSQTLVLWKDRQMAANRRRYDLTALHVEGAAPLAKAPPAANELTPEVAQNQDAAAVAAAAALAQTIKSGGTYIAPALVTTESSATSRMAGSDNRSSDPELIVPADPLARAGIEAAFARFASVFPDSFYITERARVYLDAASEQKLSGRLLSAGLHSMTGYFRDDAPLYDLVLDTAGRRELDRLWRDFDFSASVPQRMHTSFVWFERTDSTYMRDPEFTPYRPEDKSVTDQDKIRKLAELYLAKAVKNDASATVQQAIKQHFDLVAANIQRVEQQRIAAEPRHLQALLAFAQRAWRRPLTPAERDSLLKFYRDSRQQNGVDHEEAIRDSVAAVLMSPNFCYRVDLMEAGGRAPGAGRVQLTSTAPHRTRPDTRPLSDYALASRLSYFLWSSMPDAELLQHAAAGDLQRPEVLAAQARRMLKDPRARNLAAEFVGHWLNFRRFEEHNAVDRERFPSFDGNLREAMYQEPLQFFLDLVRRDASVLNFLYGDYTLVNAPLAKHYGIAGTFSGDNWVRVNHASQYGRGGLLPMAVFLTMNAPGLRTSPVKRGNWVVRYLLGERIPSPPPNVPSLPADEKHLGELTLRDALARHRQDPACAGCHAHFDSFGLAMEGYGAIGEVRTMDFGGHPVDTHAEFPGGATGNGLEGLRDYIRAHREQDFVGNLASKLLTYGLGRSLLISDDALLQQMKSRLAADNYRFGALVEAIVTSPQFRTRRVPPGGKISSQVTVAASQ